MSYTVPVFQTLKQKYATVNELETYLTSPDGGQMRVVNAGTRYKIFRYVKGVSDLKVETTRWFRSVIWDVETHMPVCVAPPKAEATEPSTGDGSSFALVQDFLDGTMINVFHSHTNPNVLEVATRTQLGAGGTFYSQKTFKQMFEEAVVASGYTEQDILNMLPAVSENNPYSFGSFLLQHPEHRVVTRSRSPRIWCVHIGSVSVDGTLRITEDLTGSSVPSKLYIPSYPVTGFRSQADLDSFFKGLVDGKGWFWQGLVLKDGKGHRWRMRNPNYTYLRGLRGSEATSEERFLRLRSERKIMEYLKHYTEERQAFSVLEGKLRNATSDIFQSYCSVHKSHEKKLADLSKPIQPFVFRLHAHFLEHLKPQGETVKMKDAVELVNNSALFEQKRLIV